MFGYFELLAVSCLLDFSPFPLCSSPTAGLHLFNSQRYARDTAGKGVVMNTQTAVVTPDQQSAPSAEIMHRVQEGKRALEQGDLDKALEHFEAVVTQHPDRPEGYNNLGALYTSLALFQSASRPMPRGLTAPTPVTTTRAALIGAPRRRRHSCRRRRRRSC